jgi:hypothetical protein
VSGHGPRSVVHAPVGREGWQHKEGRPRLLSTRERLRRCFWPLPGFRLDLADEPREERLGIGLDPLDAPDDRVAVVLEGIALLVDAFAGVVVGGRRLAFRPVKLEPVAGHRASVLRAALGVRYGAGQAGRCR